MKISLAKLKTIILYFTKHTEPRFLGKVKLMKLFYFLDFEHVRKYGSPVTFDTYIHLEHGPIPSTIKNLIDTASDDIDHSELADIIAVKKIELAQESPMCRIVPLRELTERELKYLSESELGVMNQVCLRFADKNTKQIEDASHDEAAYKETAELDEIPYKLAAHDENSKFTEEQIDFLANLA